VICFRDMTFCSGPDHSPECGRRWTAELFQAAEHWWGGPDAPVAFAPLCDVAREIASNPSQPMKGSME
jgi:hypothetical protein